MATVSGSAGGIEALHLYWRNLAGGAAPQRDDVDPAAIKSLLPYLYIVRFEADPFRVRYLLTGTETDRWNGFSLTGRYVDEFLAVDFHGANRKLLDCYQRARETAAPVFGSYSWPTRAGYTVDVHFGMFPLRVGEQIGQCLAIEDYSSLPATAAEDNIPQPDPADPERDYLKP